MYLELMPIQEAIELLPDAVLVLDTEGKIVSTNKRVKSLFDFKPSELYGKELSFLLPERYREVHSLDILNYLKHPTKRKKGRGFQLVGLRKNGTECDIDIALAPVAVNGSTFVIASVRDVTELKQLERKLIRRNEQLCVINSELERLGYIIAHDLKSPLLNIHALIRLLKRDLTEEQQKNLSLYIKAIDHTLLSMLNLISGVTEYSKLAISDRQEEELDLNQILKDACSLIHFPPNVSLDIPQQLPVIRGNKTKMIQVFLNLIGNAIKYNDKDEPRIVISYLEQENEMIIKVSDNGPGVPPELRQRIFNLFEKGHIQKENSHGIGLAVVKKIITEKGGSIKVEDSPLGGAEFVFSLPWEHRLEATPADNPPLTC